jgi:PAS domain S-box-containing protein
MSDFRPPSTSSSPASSFPDGAERLAQIGTWRSNAETGELRWSDNLFRIYGLEPGAITPSLEFVFEHVHPEDLERVRSGVEAARHGGLGSAFEFRYRGPEGAMRHLRAAVAAYEQEDSGTSWSTGVVQDVTEQSWAEQEIEVHSAVARALAEWENFSDGAEGLLRRFAEVLGYELGILWRVAGEVLQAHVIWQAPSLDADDLRANLLGLRLRRGEGLSGQAWAVAQPTKVLDLRSHGVRELQLVPRPPSFRGALAVPATRGEEILAVLAFAGREPVQLTARMMSSLEATGAEIGTFLSAWRGKLSPPPLTERELEVLQLAADGYSVAQAADRLSLSRSTVKTHLDHIYRKLGVSDRTAAVAAMMRTGVIR